MRSTGLGDPRDTAASTPSTTPIAMLATESQTVLTRPRRIVGQNRNSPVVPQSMRPRANEITMKAAKAAISPTASIRP